MLTDEKIEIIGERIRKRRKELEMSADDLGLEIGRNRATVYKYENGTIKEIPYSIMESLAEALATTTDYLTGEVDDPIDYFEWLNYSGHSVPKEFREDLTDPYDRAKAYCEFLEAVDEDAGNEALNEKRIFYHTLELAKKEPSEYFTYVPIYWPFVNAENLLDEKEIKELMAFPHSIVWEKSFGVRIWEDSMKPEILNGDIAIFREKDEISSGEIGAFGLNGEYYCRRFKELADGSRWLFSNDPQYDPILVKSSDEFRILGLYSSRFTTS